MSGLGSRNLIGLTQNSSRLNRLEPNWRRDLEAEHRAAHIKDHRRSFFRCRKPSGDVGFALVQSEGVACVENVFAIPADA